jgi:hypothetical protein
MLSSFCTVSQLGAACLARLRSTASVDMTASVVDSIAVVQFHFGGARWVGRSAVPPRSWSVSSSGRPAALGAADCAPAT